MPKNVNILMNSIEKLTNKITQLYITFHNLNELIISLKASKFNLLKLHCLSEKKLSIEMYENQPILIFNNLKILEVM